MPSPARRSRALVFLLASLAACKVDLDLPAGALVSCSSDADCPGGWVCRTTLGRCIQPGGDGTAPQLVTSSLVITPPLVGLATATVSVAFQVSEALARDPDAALRLSGADAAARTLQVVSRNETLHAYVLTYAPVPSSDAEGDVSLVATFIDAAGNEGRVELPRVAVFDFTPPDLALDTMGVPVATVTLTPAATSPIRDVTAATVGTRLRVDFAASEPLAGGTDSPVVKLGSGGSALALSEVSGNGLSFVYEAVVGAGLADGPTPLTAHLTDLAGNGADVSLGTVLVKTQRPASPAVGTADRILFHRVPWGSEATGGAESYYLRGLAGAVPAGALAIAYSAPTVISPEGALVGREIGRVAADGTGAFGGDVGDASPFQLYMGDAPDLYVAAVDAAGNVSDADGDPSNGVQAALVRDVAWTATMNGKIPGRVFPNPHTFEGRQVWTATLGQRGSKPAAVPADVGRWDGTQASVRGAPYWLPSRRYGPLGYRTSAGMAYDPVRGCRVAFGGESWDGCDSGFYCSQWESCRGSPWSSPAVEDPEGDGNPALDSGLPLLFAGGRGTAVLSDGTDLWEWDGASWRKVVMTDPEGDGNPSPRHDHAIAYDEARQRLVLFGGVATVGGAVLGDTWETDFRSWKRVCNAAPCDASMPLPRSEHAMVYDPVYKVTLLVGGTLSGGGYNAATWKWNGSAWTSCTTSACGGPSTSPAQRRAASLAYDPVRSRAVAFGGITAGGYDGAVFEWNGTAWTVLCTAAPCSTSPKPAARAHASFFFDPERGPTGRIVLFGGEVGSFGTIPECFAYFCGTEWEWSGSAWTQVLAPAVQPPSVTDVTPVYDPNRDRVVLFGGQTSSYSYSSATYEWDGSIWSTTAPTVVPAGRYRYGAAFSVTGNYVAMAGGDNGSALPSAYTWSGTPVPNWTSASALATARSRTALATSFNGALLFGGLDGAGNELCDTWELLSGRTWWPWATTCGVSSPSARAGHAMVRATGWTGAPVVLVGGANGISDLNDVWHWVPSAWTQKSAGGAASATQPRSRTNHGLLFDTGRNRVLLFGGEPAAVVSNINCVDDYGGVACHDFWEWSGSAWTRVFPLDLYGDGSPDPYRLQGIAYDTSRKAGLGLESSTGPGATLATWWWKGGSEDRPGQVMSVLFDAAEVRRAFDVIDVDVTWVGGASGAPGGGATNGASLHIWDNRAWLPLVSSSTASPTAPETLHWALSTDPTFGPTPPAERQRFMVGDPRALYLALVPNARSGSAGGFGEVSTDYVEVTVRYRLAAP
jgi:hypothetical protein